MAKEPKTIKYLETDKGSDKKNPLNELHNDDLTYMLNYFMRGVGFISDQAQQKDSKIWEQLIKRLPKKLYAGKKGPNSIASFILGMSHNVFFNIQKYGTCRISRKQMEDIEMISLYLAYVSDEFDAIRFQHSIGTIDGTML
jgi:hypothetical protein